MKTKYKIGISNLFLSSIKSPADYPGYYKGTHEFIRGFIVWLVYNGHEVSFSSNANTIINGKDAFSAGLENNVFLELISGYRESLKEREKSIKHHIEFPEEIFKNDPAGARENSEIRLFRSFRDWLLDNGHTVSYTEASVVKINGSIDRDMRSRIYSELYKEYTNSITNNTTKEKSVKYSIEYPFSCKSQWSDSFIAWLNEEGHKADYTIERASKINGTDIYRDNRLLKILGGLITEYDNLSQTIPKRNEENE